MPDNIHPANFPGLVKSQTLERIYYLDFAQPENSLLHSKYPPRSTGKCSYHPSSKVLPFSKLKSQLDTIHDHWGEGSPTAMDTSISQPL